MCALLPTRGRDSEYVGFEIYFHCDQVKLNERFGFLIVVMMDQQGAISSLSGEGGRREEKQSLKRHSYRNHQSELLSSNQIAIAD